MTSSLHPDQRGGTARPDPAELSTADLLRQLSDQVRTLVTDEVQLAKAEVTAKGKAVGIGAGLAGAGTMLALAGGLAFVAAAIAALALVLPVWASALIVGAVLVALGGVLALVAKKQIGRGTPPLPEQAIDSTKADVETIKREVHR
ncbi:phage holin family protein [Pseudonocardia halophobica]|uniref:Membrane protein n=1 Tax=Pseudonocardia halophobica TaxID=29401 RepID=A0A9W6L304_9PSEU|nr:phage holin family protein [Pseudonocardia halophobica]GLL10149.1 membrane protein [Pseudonocardia halophobica]